MKRILLSLLLLHTCMCASAQIAITPRVTPAYITPQFFGVHSHQPALPGHYPVAPVGAVRMWDAKLGEGTWMGVQPTATGGFNFTTTDAYIALVRASSPGAKIMLTLGHTPAWASARPTEGSSYGPGAVAEPADMTQWRTYVRTMATRYAGQIEAYELWNEANTTQFFSGTLAKLVEMSCAAAQEIRAADPTAKIVSPNGTGAYSPKTDFLKNFLDAGGNACVDVYAYHLYTSGSPPEKFIPAIFAMRESLVAAGYTKPLWNTETGYLVPGTKYGAYDNWTQYQKDSRVSEYDAADFSIRAMVLARAIGFERFYWYAWDNGQLGLSDPQSLLPREAAKAIARFSDMFVNGGLIGSCLRNASYVWVCTIKRGTTSENGQLVWVDPDAPIQIQNYELPYTAIVSNFHNTLAPRITRFTQIPVSASPQLLIWN